MQRLTRREETHYELAGEEIPFDYEVFQRGKKQTNEVLITRFAHKDATRWSVRQNGRGPDIEEDIMPNGDIMQTIYLQYWKRKS